MQVANINDLYTTNCVAHSLYAVYLSLCYAVYIGKNFVKPLSQQQQHDLMERRRGDSASYSYEKLDSNFSNSFPYSASFLKVIDLYG